MTKVTRSIVNADLKDMGREFGFVKANLDSYATKKISSNKGIRGGSIGPMTATNAHWDHNKSAADSIIETLVNETGLSLVSKSDTEIVLIDKSVTTKQLQVTFDLHLYRTYAHNLYDSSYQTYWWVIRYS